MLSRSAFALKITGTVFATGCVGARFTSPADWRDRTAGVAVGADDVVLTGRTTGAGPTTSVGASFGCRSFRAASTPPNATPPPSTTSIVPFATTEVERSPPDRARSRRPNSARTLILQPVQDVVQPDRPNLVGYDTRR